MMQVAILIQDASFSGIFRGSSVSGTLLVANNSGMVKWVSHEGLEACTKLESAERLEDSQSSRARPGSCCLGECGR